MKDVDLPRWAETSRRGRIRPTARPRPWEPRSPKTTGSDDLVQSRRNRPHEPIHVPAWSAVIVQATSRSNALSPGGSSTGGAVRSRGAGELFVRTRLPSRHRMSDACGGAANVPPEDVCPLVVSMVILLNRQTSRLVEQALLVTRVQEKARCRVAGWHTVSSRCPLRSGPSTGWRLRA